MNLSRKGSVSEQSATVVGDYPAEFPKLPDDVLERFPSLVEWESEVKKWYSDFQAVLTRQQQK